MNRNGKPASNDIKRDEMPLAAVRPSSFFLLAVLYRSHSLYLEVRDFVLRAFRILNGHQFVVIRSTQFLHIRKATHHTIRTPRFVQVLVLPVWWCGGAAAAGGDRNLTYAEYAEVSVFRISADRVFRCIRIKQKHTKRRTSALHHMKQ